MQGKVSMVMPCFNKVNYIGEMFDSILAQKWGNIELIFVNDGSTDGTRESIFEFESKFRARGFEVVIIDQENTGVCAAAKVGLEHVTGDYVCMVDADDELTQMYVSTMAEWLEHNSDCDYCVCGAIDYTGYGDKKSFKSDWARGLHKDDMYLTEKYLLSVFRTTPWIYMLRTDYLHKCNIINTYYTAIRGSHEPAYIIPILAYGGKFNYFPIPLYHFNINGESHSRSKQFEKMRQYHLEYYDLCRIAIDRLSDCVADQPRKKKMIDVSFVSAWIRIYRAAVKLSENKENSYEALKNLLNYVNDVLQLPNIISLEDIRGKEEDYFGRLRNFLLGQNSLEMK